MSAILQWEELRKHARQLENEIDVKLMQFSKLGASYGMSSGPADTVPLLGASGDHVVDNMAEEIEQLLSKLTNVNHKLSDTVNNGASAAGSGTTSYHTVQRHRDILDDYAADYRRTKSNLVARRERENLLGLNDYRNDSFRSGGLSRRSDLYLKENEHIRNAERLVEEQIDLATETKEHLISQRGTFHNIQGKVNALVARFPAVNNLVQKINIRRRRDAIILGLVIALCLTLLILYAWH